MQPLSRQRGHLHEHGLLVADRAGTLASHLSAPRESRPRTAWSWEVGQIVWRSTTAHTWGSKGACLFSGGVFVCIWMEGNTGRLPESFLHTHILGRDGCHLSRRPVIGDRTSVSACPAPQLFFFNPLCVGLPVRPAAGGGGLKFRKGKIQARCGWGRIFLATR